MSSEPTAKILVFTETKRKCDDLTRTMRRSGYSAMCIHGDKKQEERDWVLGEFRTGRTLILVATDVAARGLGRHFALVAKIRKKFNLPK
jgi:superfamily II DNA/RNA helicase